MAITKIHAIKSTLNKAISYITNPDKTDGFLLVSGYNCEAITAHFDFEMTGNLAADINGDYTYTGGANVLAYHLIQSFAKFDKITPEEAHELGKKLADELLEGKHEYIIATHIDKGHIHNHIIFNSTSFYNYSKFRSVPYKTAAKIRAISDRLCNEKGLYVIQQPAGKGKQYKEWEATKYGTSWKAKIKVEIDKAISAATDYDSFVKLLKASKIEVKEGAHIAFRMEGQERYARGKTIGERYTKDAIIDRISNREVYVNKNNKQYKGKFGDTNMYPLPLDKRVVYVSRKKNIAYTKDLADMLLLLRRENIRMPSDFDLRIAELKTQGKSIKEDIMKLDTKNGQYKDAAKYLVAYNKYLPVHQEYNKQPAIAKGKYYNRYQSELAAFDYAAKQLDSMGVNANVNPDKVIALVRQQDGKVKELSQQFKRTEKTIDDLNNARAKVKTIISPDASRTDKSKQKNREERQ